MSNTLPLNSRFSYAQNEIGRFIRQLAENQFDANIKQRKIGQIPNKVSFENPAESWAVAVFDVETLKIISTHGNYTSAEQIVNSLWTESKIDARSMLVTACHPDGESFDWSNRHMHEFESFVISNPEHPLIQPIYEKQKRNGGHYAPSITTIEFFENGRSIGGEKHIDIGVLTGPIFDTLCAPDKLGRADLANHFFDSTNSPYSFKVTQDGESTQEIHISPDDKGLFNELVTAVFDAYTMENHFANDPLLFANEDDPSKYVAVRRKFGDHDPYPFRGVHASKIPLRPGDALEILDKNTFIQSRAPESLIFSCFEPSLKDQHTRTVEDNRNTTALPLCMYKNEATENTLGSNYRTAYGYRQVLSPSRMMNHGGLSATHQMLVRSIDNELAWVNVSHGLNNFPEMVEIPSAIRENLVIIQNTLTSAIRTAQLPDYKNKVEQFKRDLKEFTDEMLRTPDRFPAGAAKTTVDKVMSTILSDNVIQKIMDNPTDPFINGLVKKASLAAQTYYLIESKDTFIPELANCPPFELKENIPSVTIASVSPSLDVELQHQESFNRPKR